MKPMDKGIIVKISFIFGITSTFFYFDIIEQISEILIQQI